MGILTAFIFILALALTAGLLLLLFSRIFYVAENPLKKAVRECLPGINCGACGFKGCDDYAQAIVEDGAKPNLCVPGTQKVADEIERQLKLLPREDIARTSIDNNGKIFIVDSINTAIELSNEIAPEHLEVCVDNPFEVLPLIKNAGSIFLGKNVPEALGDYFAGPNHTLPTSGTARFSSPLGVEDFVKTSQFTYYTADALSRVANKVSYFAKKEGLDAHAKSSTIRFED